MTIIDGKLVSQKVKEDVRERVNALQKNGHKVTLAVIIVGNDPASRVYVNNKKKACEFVGIVSQEYALPENVSQDELIGLIETLNKEDSINGILVQLPLPKHLDQKVVIEAISTFKDVDAFSYENVGRLMTGNYRFLPCTPSGIMKLFKYYDINVAGKNCVVVGRSNIVGKPMAMLLLKEDATVTICHSKTEDLANICRNADVLIVAVGKAKFVTQDMVKPEAIVIDVGMNRDENGKLCGDVDFDNVKDTAASITKVPGGVGPMTIAQLMENTLEAFNIQNGYTAC